MEEPDLVQNVASGKEAFFPCVIDGILTAPLWFINNVFHTTSNLPQGYFCNESGLIIPDVDAYRHHGLTVQCFQYYWDGIEIHVLNSTIGKLYVELQPAIINPSQSQTPSSKKYFVETPTHHSRTTSSQQIGDCEVIGISMALVLGPSCIVICGVLLVLIILKYKAKRYTGMYFPKDKEVMAGVSMI